jgi:hypothetical protein
MRKLPRRVLDDADQKMHDALEREYAMRLREGFFKEQYLSHRDEEDTSPCCMTDAVCQAMELGIRVAGDR